MQIFHISPEMAPVAKVGGLADVVYSLSKEMTRLNHTVTVILPKYSHLDYTHVKELKITHPDLLSYDGAYSYKNTIWSGILEGIKVIFIEAHHPAHFFEQGKIYGSIDPTSRFIYFSRTALEYLHKVEKKIDILHLHDWTTAPAAVLYREMYVALGLNIQKVVFTIHNLEHQGKCDPSHLSRAGLRGTDFLTPDSLQDPYQPHLLNLMKGGILYADVLTTVSPTYEKEIKTVEGGQGLHAFLLKYQHKLHGILNGIDTTFWNPEADLHLFASYNLSTYLKGKEINKTALRKRFNLKENPGPLVCAITRLATQKSPALIQYAFEKTFEKGGQFVLLGTDASPELEKQFVALQKRFARNKNGALHLVYDEALAHLTYAAADMIVIPSLFEPCGLTQMIAMRYGTVPLVRFTGGLADTVCDEKNGFTFLYPDTAGVDWALNRAFEWFEKKPTQWQEVIKNCMQADFSSTVSAQKYLQLYESTLKDPAGL